jgi:ribosomal protein S1
MFDEPKSRAAEPVQPEYKEGDSVQAVVTKVNKKERKIELSIRRYEQQQEKELLKKYSGGSGNPTLGETTGWTDE